MVVSLATAYFSAEWNSNICGTGAGPPQPALRRLPRTLSHMISHFTQKRLSKYLRDISTDYIISPKWSFFFIKWSSAFIYFLSGVFWKTRRFQIVSFILRRLQNLLQYACRRQNRCRSEMCTQGPLRSLYDRQQLWSNLGFILAWPSLLYTTVLHQQSGMP